MRGGTPRIGRGCRLDKDVADFPKGYDTLVGERGITLSGGQKQRTAIARAVAIDPADPGSGRRAVGGGYLHGRGDPVAAAGVMRARTSIIVSHRVSTVRDADQILVLDGGRSPSAARTRSSSRTAASMRLISKNCSKRSWRRVSRQLTAISCQHSVESWWPQRQRQVCRRLIADS